MKIPRRPVFQWLVAALAMTGLVGAGAAAAATSDTGAATAGAAATSAAPATSAPTWNYRVRMLRSEGLDRGLAGAFRKLDLSSTQQRQVKDILARAHRRFVREDELARSNLPGLFNPGSAEFAHAVHVARRDAVARIDLATTTEQRLYDVLTPSQKTQLPGVLASVRRNFETHWQQHEG
ncbi:MAG TPA: hypothetical protein VMD56_12285 [Steroidobacteraceae bacterium]|nr:hypothetical protein [Steroidobacteraceae bacterium]